MALRYQPGAEDVEMTAVVAGGEGVEDLVEEKESDRGIVVEDSGGDNPDVEDDDNDYDDEELLVIDPGLSNTCANVVADVIVKNLEDPASYTTEQISFIFEEIVEAIEQALEIRVDFSQFNYEIWYSTIVEGNG